MLISRHVVIRTWHFSNSEGLFSRECNLFLIAIPLSFLPFPGPLFIVTFLFPFSLFAFQTILFFRRIINAFSLLSSSSFTLKHFIVLDDWSHLVGIVRNYVLWNITLPATSKFSITADINQLKLTKIVTFAFWIAYSNVCLNLPVNSRRSCDIWFRF